MKAFFCEVTGRRIAAPGVCKAVDPQRGQDEVSVDADGKLSKVKSEPLKGRAEVEAASWKDSKDEAVVRAKQKAASNELGHSKNTPPASQGGPDNPPAKTAGKKE